jgi:nucleoside-diphosphate-sugar epimerase
MRIHPRLIPVPTPLLSAGASAFGMRHIWQRLGGNLQVDISKARELLGWRPPVTVDEGLRRTVVSLAPEGVSA